MHKHLVTVVAAAMAVALGGPSVQAATPAAQQVVVVPAEQMALARRNVDVVTAANQRATGLLSVLNDSSFGAAKTAEDYIAAINVMTPRVDAARAELRTIAAEIEALPDVASDGDPAQMQIIDVMVEDMIVSLGRIDALLGSVTELGAALQARDSVATEEALATLSQGMMVTLDGQAAMFRARVALANPDSSVYGQTMSLACLYDSFAAVTRGQMEFLPAAEAADRSEVALACVRQHVISGRQNLNREAGQLSQNAGIRAMQSRLVEINGRFFDALDRAEVGLNSATAVLKAGGDYDSIEVGIETFKAAELDISQLANEQMAAATSR